MFCVSKKQWKVLKDLRPDQRALPCFDATENRNEVKGEFFDLRGSGPHLKVVRDAQTLRKNSNWIKDRRLKELFAFVWPNRKLGCVLEEEVSSLTDRGGRGDLHWHVRSLTGQTHCCLSRAQNKRHWDHSILFSPRVNGRLCFYSSWGGLAVLFSPRVKAVFFIIIVIYFLFFSSFFPLGEVWWLNIRFKRFECVWLCFFFFSLFWRGLVLNKKNKKRGTS